MPFPTQLIDGYRAFLYARLRQEQDRYADLARTGQSPQVMLIGCADSRVSPEVIFDARPGEIFVVRNVANIVPPYAPDGHAHGVSAALEFGVAALKVKHIIVLGHAQCGGVKAFAEDAAPLGAERLHRQMDGADAARARQGRPARPRLSQDEYLLQARAGQSSSIASTTC